jgi:putative acetyltransferase
VAAIEKTYCIKLLVIEVKQMDLVIRKERQEDFPKVYEVNRMAFSQEDESKLIEKIRRGINFIPDLSLVAEIDNEIVGHILFSNIKIIGKTTTDSIALAPMAVIPKYQKNGIGGQLIKKGLTIAKDLGFNSVIVLGHKDYYPKYGFKKASLWNIKCPFDVPDEAFMAIELIENSLADKEGTVEYPSEFLEE